MRGIYAGTRHPATVAQRRHHGDQAEREEGTVATFVKRLQQPNPLSATRVRLRIT